jgi:hypothetical protein
MIWTLQILLSNPRSSFRNLLFWRFCIWTWLWILLGLDPLAHISILLVSNLALNLWLRWESPQNSTINLSYSNSTSPNRTIDFDDVFSNKPMTPVILILIPYFVGPTFFIKITLIKIQPNNWVKKSEISCAKHT